MTNDSGFLGTPYIGGCECSGGDCSCKGSHEHWADCKVPLGVYTPEGFRLALNPNTKQCENVPIGGTDLFFTEPIEITPWIGPQVEALPAPVIPQPNGGITALLPSNVSGAIAQHKPLIILAVCALGLYLFTKD